MSCLLLFTFFCGFFPGILAQATDYETTPEPVEPSSFTCQGRAPGYYADLETGCKSYHVCDGPNHFTYTCPERTLFQQRSRICDHSYLVRCEDSIYYYEGDVYQDLDEDDFGEDEGEEEEEEEADEGGVDYEYASNKEEPDDFEEDREEVTSSPETVKTTLQGGEETTTTRSATTDTDPSTTTETRVDQSKDENTSEKTFLKFSLKDPRWMFYIPEVENNSIETAQTRVRELVLPLVTVDKRMKFKPEVEVGRVNGSRTPCPSFCNPRFLVPGTCHPCIMIK